METTTKKYIVHPIGDPDVEVEADTVEENDDGKLIFRNKGEVVATFRPSHWTHFHLKVE